MTNSPSTDHKKIAELLETVAELDAIAVQSVESDRSVGKFAEVTLECKVRSVEDSE